MRYQRVTDMLTAASLAARGDGHFTCSRRDHPPVHVCNACITQYPFTTLLPNAVVCVEWYLYTLPFSCDMCGASKLR